MKPEHFPYGLLLFCFFMSNVFTAKRTKLLKLQTFWFLLFILGAIVINAIALSALKMNCLAHVLMSGSLCAPPPSLKLRRASPQLGETESQKI